MIRRFFHGRYAIPPFFFFFISVITIFVLSCTTLLAEEEEWRFVNGTGDISVHKRAKEDSEFLEFKAIGNLCGGINKYVSILRDTDKMPDWAPQCLEARNVEKISQSEDIVYVACKGVWPVSDRDYIAKRTVIYDLKKTNVRINIDLVNHPNVSINNKRVHIPHLQCSWILEKIDSAHTHVEIHAFVDPGGRLPAWLVNWGYRWIPYKYLKNLETMVVGCSDENIINIVSVSSPTP